MTNTMPRVRTFNDEAPGILCAQVYLPNDCQVTGKWGPDLYADSHNPIIITSMYTNPNVRGHGVATRLTKFLIRYCVSQDPGITHVGAYVTIQHSLRIMRRLFPDTLTIYNGTEVPKNVISMNEALGIMGTWGTIAEDTKRRTEGLTVTGRLEGIDMSEWELPLDTTT